MNQSYEDWEAIFVNDGSTDKTQDILDELSTSDNRIKIITQTNSGVAVAREKGIIASKGEYITFLDVDDTLLPNTLSIFNSGFKKTDVEIVVGGLILSKDEKIISRISYKENTISGIDFFKYLCRGIIRWQIYAKAFHRNLLLNISTPSGLIAGEDKAVCMQTAINAKRVLIDNRVVYDYLQNETSVSHSKNIRISIDTLKSTQFVEDSVGRIVIHDNYLKPYINAMFMLTICSALRCGGEISNMRGILINHFDIKALRKIPLLKAMVIIAYRYLHFNIFSLLKR